MKKTKVQLAVQPNITSTYVGEFAGTYIAASLLSAPTLDKGWVTVKPNIQKAEIIKKLAVADLITDGTCDFTPSGSVSLTQRKISPKELMINLELCKTPFVQDFEAMSMGFGVMDRQIPPKFSDFFLAEIGALVAEATEKTIWHGAEANNGEFTGLVTRATDDADVLDVAGIVGITAGNVIAELTKIYNAIPENIFGNPTMSIYASPNIIRAYQLALSALGYRNEYYVNEKPMDFGGIPLKLTPGLNKSFMYAGETPNMWFGTSLLSDYNQIKVLDMADIDGSQNVRIVMRFTGDSNHGIGKEIVLYTPA